MRMILETAVRDGKVMQGFEPEPLSIVGTHSLMVKGPPIERGSGSKDCVNLPSPTAVSRMMILGAGISGLSLSWHLKKRFPSAQITILEKTERAGGWLHTDHTTGFHFEKGARTFLVSKSKSLLELIQELGLTKELIWSEMKTLPRFLWLDKHLEKMPINPIQMLFSPVTKGLIPALLTEWTKTPNLEDETVWDFVSRRLNPDVARQLFDPMVMGIFGGDSREISVKACFPILKEWEARYGSITRGFLASRKIKPEESFLPRSAIFSFQSGTKTLIEKLSQHVAIQYQTEIQKLTRHNGIWSVHTTQGTLEADYVFSALPVLETATLFEPFEPDVSKELFQMKHSGVAIVNVAYKKSVLPVKGFGYLTQSAAQEDVLGVIFDSCIFPCQNQEVMETRLTIKLKERNLTEEEYIGMALKGIQKHLGITATPDAISFKRAVNAIPQYKVGHVEKIAALDAAFQKNVPNADLVGNYFSGVAVNHCVARSKLVAERVMF